MKKRIKVFTSLGVKGINKFIEENNIHRSDVINLETVIEIEKTNLKYIKTNKKKSFKLWYWGYIEGDEDGKRS